jgi:hypothetical protein
MGRLSGGPSSAAIALTYTGDAARDNPPPAARQRRELLSRQIEPPAEQDFHA